MSGAPGRVEGRRSPSAPSEVVTTETVIDIGRAAALWSLFDLGGPRPEAGSLLPDLWHWVALPAWALSSELGTDGHHHVNGQGFPAGPGARRMFAGGEVTFQAPMVAGETVHVESAASPPEHKTGRSGDFDLVGLHITVRKEDGSVALRERRDLVFRPASPVGAGGPVTPPDAQVLVPGLRPLVRRGPWTWDLHTDPTVLMRFSAATANGHRIHYDQPYATGVEGYPGLVVHGPLMTLSLVEVLRQETGGGLAALRHRKVAPLFCGQRASVVRDSSGGSGTPRVRLVRDDVVCAEVEAELAP